MKKKIMLVGIIATIGLGVYLASCSKDEDDTFNGCYCSQIDYDGYKSTFTVSAAEAQQYGLSNCNHVAAIAKDSDEEALSVTCLPL